MSRRLVAVVVAALLAAACSSDGGREVVEPPPTTLTTTPIRPPGAADVVRRWVAALAEGEDEVATGLLAPASRAAVDARALRRRWAPWGERPNVAFDAVPVADGLVAVIVQANLEDGGFEAAAVPLRLDAEGDGWLVEPLLSTGEYRNEPEDGTTVPAAPELAVVADTGVEVVAFIDGQRAETATEPAGRGRDRTTITPERDLELGWHVVTVVFRAGDRVTARTARYLVEDLD